MLNDYSVLCSAPLGTNLNGGFVQVEQEEIIEMFVHRPP